MSSLDVKALSDFMAEVLTQYARRQAFRSVTPQPGAVRINCEDDLWRSGLGLGLGLGLRLGLRLGQP